MKTKNQILNLIAFIGLSSCAPFNLIDNLKYNESVQLYEYPVNEYNSVFVRNKKGETVNQWNIDSFEVEVETNSKKYSFEQCFEKDVLKASDYKISRFYSEINSDLEKHDFVKAQEGLKQLERIYPNIKKFSDFLFLESISYAQSGDTERANETFIKFLKYSSGSYSGKVRGYRDADSNDSIFALQRMYAKDFLRNPTSVRGYTGFKKIVPQYHYNCFKPGYLINPENYARGVKWITGFVIGMDISNDFILGYQVNRNLKNGVDASLNIFASSQYASLGTGLPIQLYKAPDNRFAVKITPFFNYMHSDSVDFDNMKYEVDQGFFNFGAKISMGYYFLPNFSAGAYYIYNFRNEHNPVLAKKANLNFWWNNVYDVSLYYDIFKNFSIKTGIYNGDVVGGVFWSGWEISYDFTNPALILKVDVY